MTLIDPYLDAQTGEVMMALAKKLNDGESVVSMDISLERIQKITGDVVDTGAADMELILDGRGMVIAHSDRSEVGKIYKEEQGTLGATLLENLNRADEDFFEFSYNNANYIAYQARIQNDWRCLSVKNATEVFRPLRLLLIVTVAVVALTVILLAVILNSLNKKAVIAGKLNEQLSSVAEIYRSANDLDIINDTFSEIRTNESRISDILGDNRDNAQKRLIAVMDQLTDPVSKDEIMRFIDFSTLEERMLDQKTITVEFLNTQNLWLRGRFIVSQRTPDGRISHVLWLVENIDEEKRRRDMMFETVRKMNEQISSVANIYFSMHDVDLTNDTFCELQTNVQKVADLVGNNMEHAQASMYAVMDQMTHEQSKAAIRAFIDFSTLDERMRNTDTITEEFLSYKDVWSRARFIVSKRRPDGTLDHVLWLVEGIDEEKRRRDKLAEEAKTLTYRILSIANIYMIAYELDIVNDSFNEIKANVSRVAALVGDRNDGSQATLSRVMANMTDDAFIEEMAAFINVSTLGERLRDTETITLEYQNREGLWRRGRFIASRRFEDGTVSHVLWLVEDIDKEKKERDRLLDISERAIAASEAKSSFLSNMSHEIRTPINAVLGMNEMILRESEDKNVLAYSESIRMAGHTLLGIVNDILDFSKIEAGKMEIIPVDYDLSSVINDLVNMVQTRADAKGLILELKIDTEIPKLLNGDEVRIKQVITNILTNAVKYTEKGSVTFTVGYERIPEDDSAVYLDVSVRDTGIGIKPEDMKKLFSEFERIEEKRNRNVEGTGLGMNITKRLLEMMGTSLQVESVYGEGTTFSFRLRQTVIRWEPLGDYEESYRASLSQHKKYSAKFTAPDALVLVVDDTPMNLMVFKSLLKSTGVRIDTAGSGDEGLALACDKKYDMIFLDHMMPEKDGIETLQELRASAKGPNLETPTVCLTANAISGAREKYLAAGFDDYLTKPIDSAKLEEMLMQYLPAEKQHIQEADAGAAEPEEQPAFAADVEGIDAAAGMANCGGADTFRDALELFYRGVSAKADEIEGYWRGGDLKNYTVKVHALKSSARTIGAAELSELAKEMEDAGNAGDGGRIDEKTPPLLSLYRSYADRLAPLFESGGDDDRPPIDEKTLAEAYRSLAECAGIMDYDMAEMALDSLKEYRLPEEDAKRMEEIRAALVELDWDRIASLCAR